jgi:SpoVK/Ycf46/Vps4 family AAA+-type ATPase
VFILDKSDGMYMLISADPGGMSEQLPIGAYHVGMGGAGIAFKPASLRNETYVPIDSREARMVRREVAAFFDPAIGTRLQAAGVARRRGIILHGAPGTGKTSLVNSLIPSFLDAGAIVLVDCNADMLEHVIIPGIRRHDPDRPIVCIWDEFDRNANYSHAELLRLLDGTGACDLLLCIGCTNNLHAIPENLRARPSRFGLVLEMPAPTPELRRAFLMGKFGAFLSADEIANVISLTEGMSIDHVKEAAILFLQGYEPDEVRDRLAAVSHSALIAEKEAEDQDD